MRTLKSTTTTASTSTVMVESASASAPAAAAAMQRSPWHSPVPYLFGGLAAMLGLIAFALLILACSYWKLSGQMNGDNDNGEEDEEKKSGDEKGKGRVVYEEQFVVIMAGDLKPTCLAMPVLCSRSSVANLSNFGIDEKAVQVAADESVVKGELEMEEVADRHQSDVEEECELSSEESSHQLHLHDPQTQLEPESSSS